MEGLNTTLSGLIDGKTQEDPPRHATDYSVGLHCGERREDAGTGQDGSKFTQPRSKSDVPLLPRPHRILPVICARLRDYLGAIVRRGQEIYADDSELKQLV